MMLESAKAVAKLNPHCVKLHLLHVLKNTRLADMYARGEFELMTLEDYVETIVNQLEAVSYTHLDVYKRQEQGVLINTEVIANPHPELWEAVL